MISRRAFIGSLAGGLLAAPLGAGPPSGKVLRLGLLYPFNPKVDPISNPVDRALADGLRSHGY
jgi:hypothetical protein